MSSIKDVSELPISIKASLINIVAIIPFWYLDIHLLSNWFVQQHPFYIPIIVAFCLTVGWYLLNLIISSYRIRTLKLTNSVALVLMVAQSTGILGLASFIAYIFKCSFMMLVILSFSFCTIWLIYGFARRFIYFFKNPDVKK